ncbi:MAG: hypothetical protein MK082_04100 [Phycisphaerales bacterium]|nr:hypothetical protein [Phycisphaerales bacterium]
MTSIRLTSDDAIATDILAGPETFSAPTITVVEGLRINRRHPDATPINGCATLFRLGGDAFGMMHELNDLRELDGRVQGRCSEPVEVGVLVTIGWESDTRCACRAVVSFCRREGDAWLISLDVESALAA